MPVTVRLSKKFYDTLGEDLATELVDWFNRVDATYRNDLRELNESNFQRFDAKLEQRLAQQDTRWERRIVELDAKWERRIAELDAKWEQRLGEQESRWERRFVELEAKWEGRIGDLRAELIKWMFLFWIGTVGSVLAVMRVMAG